jgi:hypothetical protein
MKGRRRVLWWLIPAALLLAVVAIVAMFRQSLAGAALTNAANKFLGDRVSAAGVQLSTHHLTVTGLRVRSNLDEPILEADRLDVEFNVRDLLPGGKRRFGLASVDIERPHLTLIHRRDGTYNVTPPGGSQQGSQQAAPFDVVAKIRGGSAAFVDQRRSPRGATAFTVEGFNADVSMHPMKPSHYDVRLVVADRSARYAVRGRATLDDVRGWEMQRWTAPRLGIASLIDFVFDPSAISMVSGEMRAVDVRYAGIPDAAGQMARHLDATGFLQGATFYLGGLARPVRDAHGAAYAYDDGIVAPRVDALLAGTPLRIAGGIFNFARPEFRLGIRGGGSLQRLASVSGSGARLPVQGDVRLRFLVEGDATQPLVLGAFSSPRISYASIPLTSPSGNVALLQRELDVVSFGATYAGVHVGGRGRVLLERHTWIDFAGRFSAPPGTLPYTARIVPGVPLDGVVVVRGLDAKLGASGLVSGASANSRLAGAFAFDPTGAGIAGPLRIDGPRGSSLFARVALDRTHKSAVAFLAFRRFMLHPAIDRRLPGLSLPELPQVAAMLDGHIAGAVSGRAFSLAGEARARAASVNGVAIDEAHVRASGGAGGVLIAALGARGPWGSFEGNGDVASGRVAIDGRYRGSLDAVARIANAPWLTGNADVPLRIVSDGTRTIAQVSGARFSGARVGGVALSSLDGTFGTRGSAYDVYAVDAGLAGAHVVASGSIGNGGTLGVSTRDLLLVNLHGAGVPLESGRVSAFARIGGSIAAPLADAGVALDSARLAGRDVAATTALAYANGHLDVVAGSVVAGGTTIGVSGRVDGLATAGATPTYDLNARVRGADLDTIASQLHGRIPADGSLDADVRVTGSGAAPRVAGDVSIPEGSVNGLNFHGARARFSGSPADVVARGGRVVVGTTALAFDGSVASGSQSLRVTAPRADLSDFNDFFDAGDTLGGQGSIDAGVTLSPNTIATRGQVRIARAQYRRFALGDVAARWSTSGRDVRGSLSVGGRAGLVRASGDILLPSSRPLQRLAERAFVDVRASARGVDLGTWLPAAGVSASILGRVDADLTMRGSVPRATVSASAALAGGVVGGLPIHRFEIAGSARNGRAVISSAVLDAPSIAVSASGSFGLRPRDALDVRARLDSPNIAALALAAGAKAFPVTGSAGASVSLSGTFVRPSVATTIDFTNLHYREVVASRVHAAVNVDERYAELRDGEIDLQPGSIRIAARAPFNVMHPGLAPGARIAGSVSVLGVRASQFVSLLPSGSKLDGTLDGAVAVSGTALRPALAGDLALTKGYFSGPMLRSPLRGVAAHLAFANGGVVLTQAHADVGAGSIDASGSASMALHDPIRTLAFRSRIMAQHAGFDVPKYFRGIVDADLALSRAAGGPVTVAGAAVLPSARIPLTALYNPSSSKPSGVAPPPIAFDLDITAGRDVRVQSGPVDVGAQGRATLGGTLAAPTLAGQFDSTGGSVSFYRSFRLERGSVTFSPANGIIPMVEAVATTHVPQPSTDVTLRISGYATQLNVDLASAPGYDRQQILGLLLGAQQLGAVSGVQASSGQGQNANVLQSVAVGSLSEQFTRQVLEPLSAGVGGALGLQTLAINYDPFGGLSANARKGLGRNLNAVFSQNFSFPQRQSIGLEAHPNKTTSFEVTFFQQQGTGQFDPQTISASTNPSLSASQPAAGTSGFSIVLQRHF